MSLTRTSAISAAFVFISLLLHVEAATAGSPLECIRADSDGFCIEWATVTPVATGTALRHRGPRRQADGPPSPEARS